MPSVVFPAGYEHSVGNTDIAVLGINSILPSHWSIQQICNFVHAHGGSVIYLHPMKGDTRHWEELQNWIMHGYVDGWERCNARCKNNNHHRDFSLPSCIGIDLHDIDDLARFNLGLITKSFPLTIPFLENLFERENSLNDFLFEWGQVIFKKESDNLLISIQLDNDFQMTNEYVTLFEGNSFELALFKSDNQGWMTSYFLLSDCEKNMFYNIEREGIVKTNHNEYPMLQISIDKSNIQVKIPNEYLHNGFAFSINRQDLLPGSQRLSWPAPVWPPRSRRDTFKYE